MISIQRNNDERDLFHSCGACGKWNYTGGIGTGEPVRKDPEVTLFEMTYGHGGYSTVTRLCRACLAELKAEVNRAAEALEVERRRAKARAFRAGRAAVKRERTTRGTLVAAGREWFAAAPERWAEANGDCVVFRTRSNGWVVAHGSRWLCSGNQTRTEAMRWLEAQGMDLDLGEHEERA